MKRSHVITAVLLVTAIVPGTAAQAADYPAPSNPGKIKPRKGKGKTFTVCKKGCRYKTIRSAIKKARGGDTIKIKRGTYREGVKIASSRYDGLKLVGDAKKPRRVVLDGKKLRGSQAQNGVFVNSADGVTVKGLTVKNYRANGVLVANAVGYTLTNLVADGDGAYGIFAFNSRGGTMSNSEALHNNDSGFYIGQTKPRNKPKRSIVKNVKGYENVLGFSGTNMRYVTITKSKFFNNGAGIVPNALKSEKYAPPAKNVITGNEVFWNNYNYYAGAPFNIPKSGPAGLASYPLGVGVLLFGSQDTIVEKNKIYGNWLTGFGAIQQVLLSGEKDPKLKEAAILRRNTVRNNTFGLGGRDLNGRDMFYDGSGTQNCFSGNVTTTGNLPADNSTFAPCPGPAKNTLNGPAQSQAFSWVLSQDTKKPDSFEKYWIRHPHAAKKGYKPIVRVKKSEAAANAAASAPKTKKVKVGDNFFSPKKLTVAKNTLIVWKWSSENGDSHDVYLKTRPKGVKRFHSDPASTDFSFKRRLKKSGKYRIICTLHEGMTQSITVKK